jgi:threonine/homoserine/homoserine lactone efflux protein
VPDLTLPLSLPALVASAFFVSLATVAVPGPITIVATRLGLSHHTAAAFWFLVGVTALDVALFSALASGAAPYLARFGALPVVEIIGGAALIWAGVSSWRAQPAARKPGKSKEIQLEGRRTVSYVLLGIGVSAGNPHYWIWWVTAGLAFVEAARAHGYSGLAWMLAALIGGVVVFYAPLLWVVSKGRTFMSPHIERWVVRGMGVALFLLGLGLLGLGSWRYYKAHISAWLA